MTNPFNLIEERLINIENLIVDLKSQPQEVESKVPTEQFLTVQEAAKFLNLTVPTMYSKVSRQEIPFMKRSKRLYFSSIELMDYLKGGRSKSIAEIEAEAEDYLSNSKKGLNDEK